MSRQVAKFLDLLAKRNLLPERTLQKLYRQVEEKRGRGKSVRLESLANLLVEKGHLTRRQADSLLHEVSEKRHYDPEEEIGLAPLEEDRPQRGQFIPNEDPTWAETHAERVEEDPSMDRAAAPLRMAEARSVRGPEAPEPPPRAAVPQPPEALFHDLPPAAADASTRRHRQRHGRRSEWDSPLILFGGGGLVLLLLIGGLVWYLVRMDTGDAQLRAARQAYEDGAYAQAVLEYERFLQSHSGHDEASAARVHLGLAKIRRSLDSGAALEDVLRQTHNVIAEIEQEAAFGEAGGELAFLLPEIAKGLAQRAQQSDTPEAAAELTARTEEALTLLTNTKYVPKSFRPEETIRDVHNLLASVARRQQREAALETALAAMAQHRRQQQFAEAYQVHAELVRAYSDVAALPEVRSAVAEIAQAEVDTIAFREESRPAVTEDRGPSAADTVLLTTATRTGAGRGGDATAFVRAEGAVYAIDAASGDVLWRRFVGHAPHAPPLPTPDGDVLVHDEPHGELLRLAGRTGQLVWRQQVGDSVGPPVLYAEAVLVAAGEGKLHRIDLTTGNTEGFVQFAQPLATPPSVDASSGRVFVVGEQSIVYLLAADSLQCKEALYVGHAATSVSVPPAALGDTLCLAENFAVNRSRLHVLKLTAVSTGADGDGDTNEAQKKWKPAMDALRLSGRVTTPLAANGRRLAVATDLGEIRVFDVANGAGASALAPVASRDAAAKESHDRYMILRDSELWTADTRLSRLRIVATGGRLQAQNLPETYNGDVFAHPLLVVANQLIHLRRPKGRAGYLAAATVLDSGQPRWERELAAPPTDVSASPGQEGIRVATATGRLYALDAPATPSIGAGSPPRHRSPVSNLAADGIGDLALSAKWTVVRSITTDDKLSVMATDADDDAPHDVPVPDGVAAAPQFLAGGLVVPTRLGQVLLLDPASGRLLATPFQPPIQLGSFPEWTAACIDQRDRSFAIADRAGRVYLIELQEDPPRLAVVAQSERVSAPLVGELCATESAVFAVTADRRLLVLSLPDLAAARTLELTNDLAWGPHQVADRILLATADRRLHCLAANGQPLADESLSAPAAGRPLAIDERRLGVALVDGGLILVDRETGAVQLEGTIGQPVALGPVRLADTFYVVTPDSALVPLPLSPAAQLASAATPR